VSRALILSKVRSALGRTAGQAIPEPPPSLLKIPDVRMEYRIEQFCAALQRLNGKTYRAKSKADVREHVERLLAGRAAIASNAPFLAECGIAAIPGVETGFTNRLDLRERCATYPVGITSATFALADTGTLVMFSSAEEARLVSLLPPFHLAILPRERLLTGLDELFTRVPQPAEHSSSMVLITGPSRTADIEQFLVRGVHGPGEIHVVVV
jgi:L-lactate dehydrogenase complex protein LldG